MDEAKRIYDLHGGKERAVPTPHELNRQHAAFIERFRETSLDTSVFADFLATQPEETLYDFQGLLEGLSEQHKNNAQIAPKLKHTAFLAQTLSHLCSICTDALEIAKSKPNRTDVKIAAQVEIAQNEALNDEEKTALLTVLETYVPDVPGINEATPEAVERAQRTLAGPVADPFSASIIPFKKPGSSS